MPLYEDYMGVEIEIGHKGVPGLTYLAGARGIIESGDGFNPDNTHPFDTLYFYIIDISKCRMENLYRVDYENRIRRGSKPSFYTKPAEFPCTFHPRTFVFEPVSIFKE